LIVRSKYVIIILMREKGFAHLLMIIPVAIALLVGGLYYLQTLIAPGNCIIDEIQGKRGSCDNFCKNPANMPACVEFCVNSPFCPSKNKSQIKPEIVDQIKNPACKNAAACNSKECVLDMTHDCYVAMDRPTNMDELMKAGPTTFTRNYILPIRGVWEPGQIYNRIGLLYFLDDYKKLQVNTWNVLIKYSHLKEDKTLVATVDYEDGVRAENEAIADIIRAKRAGFQVIFYPVDLFDLMPQYNPRKDEKINVEDYADDFEKLALKWAEIAEKYQVEYYAPFGEVGHMLVLNGMDRQQAAQIISNLYKKIIPEVRKIYHGKIYCKEGDMKKGLKYMDFSPCDLFGFSDGSSSSIGNQDTREIMSMTEELAQKYKRNYIMGEAFSMTNVGGEGGLTCPQVHENIMNAYKDIAKHGVGYTFMGLVMDNPGGGKDTCPIYGAKSNKNVMGQKVFDMYQDFYTNWLPKQKLELYSQ